MSVHIQGIGWATPLGRELEDVWQAVKAGARPSPGVLENPFGGGRFAALRIAAETIADITRHPRLRRSSAISHFAAAAALDAMKDGGTQPGDGRLALVFASTNGGVNYTRRFFEDVAKSGTQAGSPLLFPETVYNAPASHIAALLGITGIVTTIVNDATAGLDAIATAADLLETGACDRCLVVAAEEADWVLCEACARWKGVLPAVFGEGAAALLLARDGDGPRVEEPCAGALFRTIAEARAYFSALPPAPLVVTSKSGAALDAALGDEGDTGVHPRLVLGEAFAASTVMQAGGAALDLRGGAGHERALVTVAGLQGQARALELRA